MKLRRLAANLRFCIARLQLGLEVTLLTGMHVTLVGVLLGASAAYAQSPASGQIVPERELPTCDSYRQPEAWGGTTAVNFELTRKNDAKNARIVHSSGDADLDAAALKCTTNSIPTWDMDNQRAIAGGVIANVSAVVQWKPDGHSNLSFGCPYPILALRLNQQGKIGLSFKILKDGTVSQPVVVQSSGSDGLDSAAVSCVAKWRYVPVLQQGSPVEFDWHGTVTFGLAG